MMGSYEDPRIRAFLELLLGTRDPHLRLTALEASTRQASAWGLARALIALRDEDEHVREHARQILGRATPEQLHDLFAELLDRGDTTSLTEAAEGLSRIIQPALMELFERVFSRVDLSLKRVLARALIEGGDPDRVRWVRAFHDRIEDVDGKALLKVVMRRFAQSHPEIFAEELAPAPIATPVHTDAPAPDPVTEVTPHEEPASLEAVIGAAPAAATPEPAAAPAARPPPPAPPDQGALARLFSSDLPRASRRFRAREVPMRRRARISDRRLPPISRASGAAASQSAAICPPIIAAHWSSSLRDWRGQDFFVFAGSSSISETSSGIPRR